MSWLILATIAFTPWKSASAADSPSLESQWLKMYQYPLAPLFCTQTPEKEMEKEFASHVPAFEAALSYCILTQKRVAEIQILGE